MSGICAPLAQASSMMTQSGGIAIVADDEPIVLRLGQLMLRHFGFEVLTAANGHDALQDFMRNQDKVRIVLLDLTMPVLNGVETLRAIRAMNSEVPVIICSGYSNVELPPDIGPGYSRVLPKPFTFAELERLVVEAFQRVEVG